MSVVILQTPTISTKDTYYKFSVCQCKDGHEKAHASSQLGQNDYHETVQCGAEQDGGYIFI